MIIVSYTFKGGTGKTTLTINLLSAMARYLGAKESGKPILGIDLDPQTNLTMTLEQIAPNSEDANRDAHIGHFFNGEKRLIQLVRKNAFRFPETRMAGINGSPISTPRSLPVTMIAAHASLRQMDDSRTDYATLFRGIHAPVAKGKPPLAEVFEHIFIDTPPHAGFLSMNALFAADAIVIPVKPSAYDIQALETVLSSVVDINAIKARQGLPPATVFVVPSIFDGRAPKLATDAMAKIHDACNGVQLINPIVLPAIPKLTTYQEAVNAGLDVFSYQRWSPAAGHSGKLALKIIEELKLMEVDRG